MTEQKKPHYSFTIRPGATPEETRREVLEFVDQLFADGRRKAESDMLADGVDPDQIDAVLELSGEGHAAARRNVVDVLTKMYG